VTKRSARPAPFSQDEKALKVTLPDDRSFDRPVVLKVEGIKLK